MRRQGHGTGDGDRPPPTSVASTGSDADRLTDADLAVVDALAQLTLVARRMGCRLVLRRVSVRLRRLLDLSGLSEAGGVLVVEPVRQAEQREHAVGVEEEREPGDASG